MLTTCFLLAACPAKQASFTHHHSATLQD